MTQPDDHNLEQAAFEQRIANLTDDEFDALMARTRAPRELDDLAARIVKADNSGDFKLSFALKAQQLRELQLRDQPVFKLQ